MPNSAKRRKPIRGRPRDMDADARILKTALVWSRGQDSER